MFKTIIVGVDGSKNSIDAFDWAAELARATGAELIAIHSMGLLPVLKDGIVLSVDEARADLATKMDRDWCKGAAQAGLEVIKLVVEGNPTSALIAQAERYEAAILVVGTRGHGVGEASIGSTAHRVIEESPVPVVVLPPIST